MVWIWDYQMEKKWINNQMVKQIDMGLSDGKNKLIINKMEKN